MTVSWPFERSYRNVRAFFVSYRCSMQMLYGYLQSFRQPWFEADIQGVLDEPPIAALRRQPYVSMHIRRADKKKEARPTNTTVRTRVPACERQRGREGERERVVGSEKEREAERKVDVVHRSVSRASPSSAACPTLRP